MKILILKDWNTPLGEFGDHWDGIMAAFWELQKSHQVKFVTKIDELKNRTAYVRGQLVYSMDDPFMHDDDRNFAEGADAIICWGSLDRPWHAYLDDFKRPVKVLCHAGGPTEHPHQKHFDIFACESQVYIDRYKAQGKEAIRAFGVNTQIFRREARTPRILDALYPASFCFHKNHELFGRAIGGFGLCVGNHNEETIVSKLLQLGTPVMRRVSSESLCDLYNLSHTVVLPGGPDSGAQRVVLEAMACGTPVVVSADNDKCVEFVKESGFGMIVEPIDVEIKDAVQNLMLTPIDPSIGIEYVKSKWTEHHYAQALLEAISIAKSKRG